MKLLASKLSTSRVSVVAEATIEHSHPVNGVDGEEKNVTVAIPPIVVHVNDKTQENEIGHVISPVVVDADIHTCYFMHITPVSQSLGCIGSV